MIDPHILSRIARTLQGISLQDIPKNWWTEFSTWHDFQALLRTGTLLSVHRVVERIGSKFGKIDKIEATLKMIDDNNSHELTECEFSAFLFELPDNYIHYRDKSHFHL